MTPRYFARLRDERRAETLRQELSIAIVASIQTGGRVKPHRFMPSYSMAQSETARRVGRERMSPQQLLERAVMINMAFGGRDLREKQA